MTTPEDFPKRFPLTIQPANRASSSNQDARLVNCFIETQPNGDGTYIIKRPGLALNSSQSYGTAGAGLGIFQWNLDIYQVVDTHFIKNGISIGTVANAANSPYYFTAIQGATPTLFFGNGAANYYYNTSVGLQTATPSYNTGGLVTLDGTVYFVDQSVIHGSGINDVTVWDPLNVLPVQIEPDFSVRIAKHLTYVIVFKQWTTEVFTDNGNPSGSPLISNPGSLLPVGCLRGRSVIDVDGDLFWVAGTKSGSVDIYRMTGLTPHKISTPPIQKLIETSTLNSIYTWYYKGSGHTFYVLTLVDLNLTLAYDIDEDYWSQWTDYQGNYLPISGSSFQITNTLLQHATNGNVYTMDLAHAKDYNGTIPVDIYTPEFDGRVDRRKMLTMLRFNSDHIEGSVLQVRNNDYSYRTDKWTNFRMVNLANQRPVLTNCGTFYSRAYHLRHVCNTPLRLYSVDLDISLGSL